MAGTNQQAEITAYMSSIAGNAELTAQTDLIASGLIDSLTMMDLIVFIETNYDIRLDFSDLTPENMRTVSAISRLIENRMNDRDQSAAA